MKINIILRKTIAVLCLIIATPFTAVGVIVWFIKASFHSGLDYGEDFADWLVK